MESWHPIARVYHPLTAGSIDGTDTRPHDRAVERAIKASYVPPSVDNDPHLTLFVARLNPETTEKTLRKTFSKYGDIKQVNLIRDVVTGFSKQYAFIEFEEERSARRARAEADQSVIEEHIVFVDWECEHTLDGWIPRRLGGGLGGKKESGQLRFGGRDRPFRKPIVVQAIRDRDRDSGIRDKDREIERDRGRENRDRDRDRGIERDRDGGIDRDRDSRIRDKDREIERDRGRENRDRENRDRDGEIDRDGDRGIEPTRGRETRDREDTDRERGIGKEKDTDTEDGEIKDRDREYSTDGDRRTGRYRDRERDNRGRDRGKDESRERLGDRYRDKDRDRYRERERDRYRDSDRDRHRDRRKERDREREGERKERKGSYKEREDEEGIDEEVEQYIADVKRELCSSRWDN